MWCYFPCRFRWIISFVLTCNTTDFLVLSIWIFPESQDIMHAFLCISSPGLYVIVTELNNVLLVIVSATSLSFRKIPKMWELTKRLDDLLFILLWYLIYYYLLTCKPLVLLEFYDAFSLDVLSRFNALSNRVNYKYKNFIA